MAKIPLKEITFPGLDNTYTIPEIDNTLSTAGKAADAKKTGDEISELKEDLTDKADTVDMLKAFPTDTASGSVASFADGANVPVKSLVVNIDPVQSGSGDPSPDNVRPISGWSAVDIKQSGKFNVLADFNSGEGYVANAYLKSDDSVVSADSYYITAYFPVTPDTDCLVDPSGIFNAPSVCFYDSDKNFIIGQNYANREKFIVHTPANCAYARMTMNRQYMTTEGFYDNYSALPISLGRTVYGATLNVLAGILTIKSAIVHIDSTTPYVNAGNDQTIRISVTVPDSFTCDTTNILTGTLLSDKFKEITNSQSLSGLSGILYRGTNNHEIIVGFGYVGEVLPNFESVSSWLASNSIDIVYALAAPITVQLTPHEVTALLGSNNIWADSGDSAVEYRADPTLYIGRLTEPDADMVADANITSGQYFMVGNTLYKATANIASGANIVPNVNCTRKSLSEALNEINA